MAPAPERADALARLDGLVLALDPLRQDRPHELLLLVRLAGPVDRPPVVRVDQIEAPALVALVDVRHARARQLEQRLRQRDLTAKRIEPSRELLQPRVLL